MVISYMDNCGNSKANTCAQLEVMWVSAWSVQVGRDRGARPMSHHLMMYTASCTKSICFHGVFVRNKGTSHKGTHVHHKQNAVPLEIALQNSQKAQRHSSPYIILKGFNENVAGRWCCVFGSIVWGVGGACGGGVL